jgi:hypothetical protein
MKVKTNLLKDEPLDWAVSRYADKHVSLNDIHWGNYTPSRDFALGGPILSRERISRTIDHSGLWIAYWSDGYTEGDEGKLHMQCDRSELVAGLRCVVARKLGDEVEVPDELV